MDNADLSWILDTIIDEIQDVVYACGSTARQVWVAIEEQFLNNREACALHLDVTFWTFVYGDLSITKYSRQMKSTTNPLRDINESVSNRTVVLNLLWGLNERYDYLRTQTTRSITFHSFHKVHNDLIVKEITKGT